MHYNQQINFYVMHWKKLLGHVTITIAHKNLILEIGYTHFVNVFPKVSSLKTYCAYFFFGQVVKKVNFYPCIVNPPMCVIMINMWAGGSLTRRFFCCLLAKATWWIQVQLQFWKRPKTFFRVRLICSQFGFRRHFAHSNVGLFDHWV